MNTSTIDTQVLIVGAGPVGLCMAIELGWRGIDCVLLERGDGSCDNSRIQLLTVRTMEFARRWGIAARLRACGFPEDYPLNIVFCTSLNGRVLGRSDYPSMRDEPVRDTSPEKKQRCPQMWFQPILLNALLDMPSVTVKRHCEFESLQQSAKGVVTSARDAATGRAVTIASQYVVACDGAGSEVRKQLGLSLLGDEALSYSTGIYLQAPGLLKTHPLGPAERYLFAGPEGIWGNLSVADGDRYWRLTVLGSKEKVESSSFDADFWVRKALGRHDVPYTIDAVLPWRRGRMVADRYASGRVFLAGDAAHVMSPTGGYGMNTGIQDAVDLGWKLDAVLRGWGGPALLDAYDAERRPVGWRNVDAAALNFRNLGPRLDFSRVLESGDEAESDRQSLGHALVEGTRSEWEITGVVLGHRYEGSPIVVGDGSPATADDPIDYVPTARPGHRAPHAWLEDGRSMLDLFGRGYTLLRFGGVEADAAPLAHALRRHQVPIKVVSIERPDIASLYERRFVLVRPDGHVAWRGDTAPVGPDADAVADVVRGA